ncbi:MAG: hypothetical protein ACI81A_001131, partial [Paraglaciecola sp.]
FLGDLCGTFSFYLHNLFPKQPTTLPLQGRRV